MRHITFALLLPSAVQSIGLSSILRRLPDTSCTINEINSGNYIEDLSRLRPSIVIVDPLVGGIDWDYLKGASSFPVKLIALLSQQMPKDLLTDFDDIISIYDTPESIIETISRNLNTEREYDRGKDLSPREKEVIVGVVKGLSNKEIASMLNVSVNTIMTHRRNIASKLHIHTPAGLTIYAIVSNLVSLDDIKADLDKI